MTFTEILYTGKAVPMFAYVTLTLLAFFVLMRNPRAPLNRIFFFLAMVSSFWNVAMFLVLGSQTPEEAATNWKLYELAVLLLVPTWVSFALRFAGKSVAPSLVYAPSMAFVPLLFFTDLLFKGVTHDGAFYYEVNGGTMFAVYSLYILSYILYGLYKLVGAYFYSAAEDRMRIKWVTGGIGVVVLTGSIDTLLSLSGATVLPIAPATSLIAVAAIAYSFTVGESA
ncbi:MAG: hypothetical protein HYS81_02805 [Candidatus Aenigmatarchaeota archaeon]|nr:MAG: hypothetical protein HYS81_02805 [Candidatus Aenigmarchaeota archaeon]